MMALLKSKSPKNSNNASPIAAMGEAQKALDTHGTNHSGVVPEMFDDSHDSSELQANTFNNHTQNMGPILSFN